MDRKKCDIMEWTPTNPKSQEEFSCQSKKEKYRLVTETFETVSQGELQLIGVPKLKGITISSFFPARDYPYLRDTSMKGWEYVYKIDTWIEQKLPIRLIITDTPINMAVAVKDFDYSIKTDGDLWYNIFVIPVSLL